jgi:hypothetical protein
VVVCEVDPLEAVMDLTVELQADLRGWRLGT